MILIIGATGNIGKHVVAKLHAQGFPLRVFSRNAAHAATLLPTGVQIVQGDLAMPDQIGAALAGVERVFLTTNSDDKQVEIETRAIEAIQKAHVQHLVKVSVIGASPTHYVAYAQFHAAIEAKLAAAGVPATILRPNWFSENFFGSAQTIAQGALYGSAGDGRVAFVDSRDTAAVAVAVLTNDGHTGKSYQITGPQALTFAEAAQQIGVGLGRPVSYVNLADTDFQSALVEAGLPNEVAGLVIQINRNAREGNLAEVTTTVRDLTGSPARTLEEFARDHAEAFRAM